MLTRLRTAVYTTVDSAEQAMSSWFLEDARPSKTDSTTDQITASLRHFADSSGETGLI